LVTNEQLYIMVGIPMLFNAMLIGFLIACITAKVRRPESKFDAKFEAVDARFDAVHSQV
jgi:hypothetical protein